MKLLWQLVGGQFILSTATIDLRLYVSPSYDPWHNLSLEEAFLSTVGTHEIILFLWQNEKTVVIGRNQNAWKECRCKELQDDGGRLARRLSGGGAVFHDLGNLNFTFIMHRHLYDLERQLSVILQAVRSFGIHAEFSGRNDLVADGKKFSGNAFFWGPQAAYHHGTLLVRSDFSKLNRYLQVSYDKIASKGIESVKSRVVNLAELNGEVTVPVLIPRIKECMAQVYGQTVQDLKNVRDLSDRNDLYQKYSSWQWCYGETPEFNISFEHRFPWGGVELLLDVEGGVISSAKAYSDAMDVELFQRLPACLQGVAFRKEPIRDAIARLADRERTGMISDLERWLTTTLI